ncbi:hypothetical protein [Nitrospirillum pindoramense]|uniref:GGDEF domain-containing protein n=1 Tax=Nitrospirillum amazonense TaxID=28077 RepID=A0A560HFX0_9PROT|nr:hypothetical protein [Nitrospirillum amazonense]TWB44374.1 hypothetical protein FBZ90_103281 [Nitrospirillum amazonense]
MDGTAPQEPGGGHFTEAAPKLRAIFQAQTQACAGSLHMVGLESLHARLGERWPLVSDRVHMLAERLLGQMLNPKDAWFRFGEEAYIVVFAQLGRTEAGLICAKLVEQLQRLLLGDVDTATVRVHSAVQEVGGELLFHSNSLRDMLMGAALQAPPSQGPGAGADKANNPWQGFDAPAEEPVEIVYRPIWDVRKEVLSIYQVRAKRPRRGRQPLWGYDCAADPHEPQQILTLDLTVLRQTMEVYGELYRNQFRCFLSVPVHFETLAGPTRRREYLAALQAIPKELAAFLTFQVYGLPHGVPVGRATEIVTLLRQFSRVVIATVDDLHDLAALAAAGVYIASIQLPPGAAPKRWGPELSHFAHEALRLRLRPGVEGVDTSHMASYADGAGFHYIAGDIIGTWCEVPENALRLTHADLRARIMADN